MSNRNGNVDFSFRIDREDDIPVLVSSKPLLVVKYECQRCGYTWMPKVPDPDVCPNCKNDWHRKPVYNKGGSGEEEEQ